MGTSTWEDAIVDPDGGEISYSAKLLNGTLVISMVISWWHHPRFLLWEFFLYCSKHVQWCLMVFNGV